MKLLLPPTSTSTSTNIFYTQLFRQIWLKGRPSVSMVSSVMWLIVKLAQCLNQQFNQLGQPLRPQWGSPSLMTIWVPNVSLTFLTAPMILEAPSFQFSKGGRIEQDAFDWIVYRVVCCYNVHQNGGIIPSIEHMTMGKKYDQIFLISCSSLNLEGREKILCFSISALQNRTKQTSVPLVLVAR